MRAPIVGRRCGRTVAASAGTKSTRRSRRLTAPRHAEVLAAASSAVGRRRASSAPGRRRGRCHRVDAWASPEGTRCSRLDGRRMARCARCGESALRAPARLDVRRGAADARAAQQVVTTRTSTSRRVDDPPHAPLPPTDVTRDRRVRTARSAGARSTADRGRDRRIERPALRSHERDLRIRDDRRRCARSCSATASPRAHRACGGDSSRLAAGDAMARLLATARRAGPAGARGRRRRRRPRAWTPLLVPPRACGATVASTARHQAATTRPARPSRGRPPSWPTLPRASAVARRETHERAGLVERHDCAGART